MNFGEGIGGGPHHPPAVRLETLPDANRGTRNDVRPSHTSPGATVTRAAWVQDVESSDYTIYCTRVYRLNALQSVRDISLDVEFGSGIALCSTRLARFVPPPGLVYHVSAQTVRATLALGALAVAVEAQQDDVITWIARGRPFVSMVDTDSPGNGVRAQIPSFARRLRIAAKGFTGFPPAAPPNSFFRWFDPGGNFVGDTYLDPARWFLGQDIIWPARASAYELNESVIPSLALCMQWEVAA